MMQKSDDVSSIISTPKQNVKAQNMTFGVSNVSDPKSFGHELHMLGSATHAKEDLSQYQQQKFRPPSINISNLMFQQQQNSPRQLLSINQDTHPQQPVKIPEIDVP
jgi:hypothetical protein